MTKLVWRGLRGGGRGAVVPDSDDFTARYVIEQPDQPTLLYRATAPDEPPQRRAVIRREHCGGDLVVSLWSGGGVDRGRGR
jgi:hypothetical protein